MSNKSDEKLRQKHKHYDCIVAWAEGKEIEYYSEERKAWRITHYPSWETSTEYRIKPEPKPDVVLYGDIAWLKAQGRRTKFREDCIKLTFDGETEKLKSAEVLDV